jgi:hypothetical protein
VKFELKGIGNGNDHLSGFADLGGMVFCKGGPETGFEEDESRGMNVPETMVTSLRVTENRSHGLAASRRETDGIEFLSVKNERIESWESSWHALESDFSHWCTSFRQSI